MKVFVMWSGADSRQVAEGICDLLQEVIIGPKFFVSSRDLEMGKRWQSALEEIIQEAHVGIACITPGRENSPWMHFEAGAISKLPESRLYPVLVGLPRISGPLAQFLAVDASDEDSMRALARSLNQARPVRNQIKDETLERRFEKHWPNFWALVSRVVDR